MRNTVFLSALCLITSLSALAQKDMKADIMAANEKFMDTFAKGATGMADHYTTDAQLMPPNSDVVQGTANISAFWKAVQGMGIKKAKLETMTAEQSGDQVIEMGRYTLYGDKDAQLDAGKYVVIWKQEGGQWKLHRDIWNTNTPPAVAAK